MPAAQDIYAPSYLRFESKVLTERARQAAMKDTANEVGCRMLTWCSGSGPY
jgi:hypothetical protein